MKFSDLAKPYDEIADAGSQQKVQLLAELMKNRKARIEPSLVIEVDFQDIQATDAYDASYALRIPRFQSERTDKSPAEANSMNRLKHLYDRLS